MFPADSGPSTRQRGKRRQRVPTGAGTVAADGVADAEGLAVALMRGRAMHGLFTENNYQQLATKQKKKKSSPPNRKFGFVEEVGSNR